MSQLVAIREVPEDVPAARTGVRVTAAQRFEQVRLRVPRELAVGFRRHAGPVARAAVDTVAREVPAYAEALEGPLGPIVAAAAQTVIVRGIDAIVDPRAVREDCTELFRSIGAAEFAAGRELESLLAAYRVAERVLAQQVAVFIRRFGGSSDLGRLCVEVIGTCFRELALRSTEGYTEAQAADPRHGDRSRRDLARLLMSEHPMDAATIAAAARAARWPVPDVLVVVALHSPDGEALPAGKLAGVLVGDEDEQPWLITAAGDPELPGLLAGLSGWRAAIGPPVPATGVRSALRVARRALDLGERGLLPDTPVVDCIEHHTTLTLFADDWLVDRLIELRLAPLAGLTERQADRLLVTLHECLITRGQANEIAERLDVHPQTVRYRMKKLDELFGDELTDPGSRFELALAARAMLLRRTPNTQEVSSA